MFKDWLQYGDTEIANNQRVSEYVKNGLTPVGAIFGDCADCTDLADVLGEVDGYQTPMQDGAPWFTPRDPDSADFAGVSVVDITGLEGSTIQVEISDRVGDGGVAGTRRAASRIIAVTADVVGRTREAASLGIEWLSSALHPPCAQASGCGGDTLHLYSTCPVACEGQTDPDADPIVLTYDEPAEFQTSGLTSTNTGDIKNYIINPSAEDATLTTWQSNVIFGAYDAGTVTKSSTQAVSRTNSVRLATPAMAAGRATNIVAPFTVDIAGVYEFSCWVYVPTATATRVRAANLFSLAGPFMGAKDDWVRVSVVETLGVGDHWMGITTDSAQVPATGSFIYMDAARFTRVGSFPASSNYQGGSADTEGWYTGDVFGNFTPAAAIATDAFAGPAPESLPRSLKITWGWPITGATSESVAYINPSTLVNGQVYTVECDIYVPTGSPDVKTDVLFNGTGATYSTKNAWTHVKHTFLYDGFSSFGFKASPTGASQVLRVSNLRFSPGFGTMQPLSYFDGAKTDIPYVDLGIGITPTAVVGTITTGVVGPDGEVWSRLNSGSTARLTIPEASLTDYETYVSSWLVMNTGAAAVTVSTDWCDVAVVLYVIQPGEKRRVYAKGARDYTAAIRFADLTTAAGETILFRDSQVWPEAPYNFAWTGAAETTTSTATPLGNAFIFKPDSGDSIIYGAAQVAVCDDIRVEWTLSSPTGVIFTVQPSITTEGGTVLLEGDIVSVGATPVVVIMEMEASPDAPNSWRPALTTFNWDPANPMGNQVVIHSLTVTARPVLTIEECTSPYRRTLRNVVTVDGPRVTEWRSLGDLTSDSTVARVEWTWIALEPHMWHEPIPILTDVPAKTSAAPVYQAPGVPISNADTTISGSGTVCARPAVSLLTCADNTLCGTLVLPPAVPTLADSCVMSFAGTGANAYTRRYFEIPEDLSPIGVGALSWTFVNDATAKLGIRVRIHEDTDPAFVAPSPECGFVEEFTIDFLAASQTLYIDGTTGEVYVQCGVDVYGDPIYASSLRNVRGNYGGPFKSSLIGCGRPYIISVDVPNNYVAGVTGYTPGNPQGTLTWSVDLTRRA